MGFNEFLSSIFGNKSTRDMKEIKPWVDKDQSRLPGGCRNWTTTPSVPKRKNSKNISMNSATARTCESGRVEGKH